MIMSKQTFGSFKELLIKSDLSSDESSRPVNYQSLVNIFSNCSKETLLANAKLFNADESKALTILIKKFKTGACEPTPTNMESVVKEQLSSWSNKSLLSFIDLLEPEAEAALAQIKNIAQLAKKYQPKDQEEEIIQLKERVKEIQLDIINIEMTLMQLEKDAQQNTEPYKKSYNARERRKQLMQKLEKQIQGIEKKRAK